MAQTAIPEKCSPAKKHDDARWPVAIIGAGPYGLAAAAHLRAAGLDTQVFGDPMVFWRKQMPAGMLLRSGWEACFISDPKRELTLDRFKAEKGLKFDYPVPLKSFVDYGRWFQEKVVPDLDQRMVERLQPEGSIFRLLLEDGTIVRASRVVVATGIAPFAWRPHQFDGIPRELASHTSEQADLRAFNGKRVVVVGGGQSALESAALLHEGGADAEVIMRAPGPIWIGQNFLKTIPKPYRFIFYPPTDVGPLGLNWLVALPDLFRLLPRDLQGRFAYRSIRPMGGHWLRPRVDGAVKITTGVNASSTTVVGEQVHLRLSDGTQREVDHVLLGTGYRVDIARYPFMAPELVRSLRLVDGYPVLRSGFESSVPGLYFLGAPAAWSFGPLMRFVSGTDYATRSLARRITREVASSRR